MTKKKKILIAEDELAAAETMREYFVLHGYDCDIVSEGNRVSSGITPDTVALVLDINLADGKTGLKFLPEIKKRHPNLKTLVITGDRIPENRLKSLQLGADFFFSKPVDLTLLLAYLKKPLSQKGVA